jgi:hypothetical protein
LIQQLLAIFPGRVVLEGSVGELLSIDWLVPAPTANVRIINNVLIVIALLQTSFVNETLFKYASAPTESYQFHVPTTLRVRDRYVCRNVDRPNAHVLTIGDLKDRPDRK